MAPNCVGVSRMQAGLTWGLRARRIQVGGMTTAAWTPREHGSSICCSMKQDTLLWYWGKGSRLWLSWVKLCPGTSTQRAAWGMACGGGVSTTHCLLAPGAADGHDLLAVEGKLLLEALGWTGRLGHQKLGPEQQTRPLFYCQPLSTKAN